MFEPFRAPRSGNFSTVPVYGYRRSDAGEGRAGAGEVRRRSAGGRSSGASAAAACCSGRRRSTRRGATCRSAAVFLPFIHQSMRYLPGYTEPRPWLTVGQVLDASTARARSRTPAQRVVLTPSGRRVPLAGRGLRRDGADRAGLLRAARPTTRTWSWWRPTSTRPRPT